MQVKDLLIHEQLTVDAYADRAEIVRTDPVTYQTQVIQFSPKALLEGNDRRKLRTPTAGPGGRSPASIGRPTLVLVEGEVKKARIFHHRNGRAAEFGVETGRWVHAKCLSRTVIMLVRESVKLKQQAELDRFIASERQRLTAQSAGIAAGTAGLSTAAALTAGGTIAEQQVLSLRLQQLEATASRIELGRVVFVWIRSNA